MIELPDWMRGTALLAKYGNEYVVIASDADGHLHVLATGQDSGGNPTIIQTDDAGQLIMVPRGQGGYYLDVDASGYLTTVIKGDYAGALRTVKLDDAGRLSAFVIDSVDAWGDMLAVGNAELAARLVGAPVSFDRRGDIIHTQSFENGFQPWLTSAGGSDSVSLYPDLFLQGGYSAKLYTAASGASYAQLFALLPTPPAGKGMGLAAWFAFDAQPESMWLKAEYRDSTTAYRAWVFLNESDSKIYIKDENGDDQEVGTWIPSASGLYYWHYMKVAFDQSTSKYIRFIVDGQSIDLSSYSTYDVATSAPGLFCEFSTVGRAASAASVLVDCLSITVMES